MSSKKTELHNQKIEIRERLKKLGRLLDLLDENQLKEVEKSLQAATQVIKDTL